MTRSQALEFRAKIVTAAQAIPDEAAPTVVWMFDKWHPNTDYITGDRRTDGGVLYKCRQNHTSLAHQRPADVPALWVVLADPSETGTRDNPINYILNMELKVDLYYVEDGVLYVCTRPLEGMAYHLRDLVGHFVEIAS